MQLWWDLVPVGVLALVLVGFFSRAEYLHGERSELAAPLWAFAWATLFGSGLLLGIGGDHPLVRATGRLGDSLFPVLLLAGAFAVTARPLPRWLWGLGAGLVVLEIALSLVVSHDVAIVVFSLLEAPIQLAAAWLVWSGSTYRRAGLAERALPFLLAAVALLEVGDLAIDRRWGDQGVILAWLVVALTTAFLQVLVFAERSRARERRLRAHRRLLQRAARSLLEPVASREALVAVVREVEAAGLFPFFGVWMRSEDGRRFEVVEATASVAMPAVMRIASTERPLLLATLDANQPIFLDPSTDPRVTPELQSLGIRHAFLAPLRAGDRKVGAIGGTFAREPDRDDRELIADLADTIAVVVANTQLRQTIEQRTTELGERSSVLRATVDCVPVGIVMTEPDGRIVLVNRAVAQQLDLPDPAEWTGRSAFDLFASVAARIAPPARRVVERLIELYGIERTPRIEAIEIRIVAPEERILILDTEPVFADDGRQLGRVTVTRDVTSEREIAEHMQHAERMETVGTLAGGLAHDFNNQLTAILGNARLVLDKLPPEDGSCAPLLDLERSAEYCAELTQGLLAFARQGPASRSAVSIEVAIAEVESLLRPTFGPDVVLRSSVAAGTPPLAADAFQLRRVLVNLVANGRDAVGRRGEIDVWARSAARDPDDAGAFVEIGIRDDGVGMDEPTRRRIFDPFFSTKELGRGTGLGLAIVYGIVAAHGGSIVVESALGAGTTFRIRWPAARGATLHDETPARRTTSAARCATILVAEDEPSVRRLTRTALERAGHRVIEACDGDEAVAQHAAHRGEIDLAVLDLSMPRRNGLDALDAMRATEPALRAIVMSGHPDRERSRAWPPDVSVLPKPFGPRALIDQVDRALA